MIGMRDVVHEDPLKVVHIISGLGVGGAEGVLVRLCLATQAHNLHHTVISLTERGANAEVLQNAGFDVICLRMRSATSVIAGVGRLIRLLRSIKPDVVQTWLYHADLIGGISARLAGVRCVIWGVRSTAPLEPVIKRSTRTVVRLCALVSCCVPKKIVICAENSIEAHASIGYKKEKMVAIQNGVDTRRFCRDDAVRFAWRSREGLHSNSPLLGLIARFSPQKDHRNMLAALQLLASGGVAFQCVFIGAGAENSNETLTSQINAHGLTEYVTLMGERSDIPDATRALDLLVLSSRIEGFPNVLGEAMASGTPCVSTNVGDAEYIVGECGWLVPKCDPAALADAISAALTEFRQSPERWQQRRDNCVRHIRQKFGMQQMVEKYVDVWRAAVQDR